MKILDFFYICWSFLPSCIRIRNLNTDPDPATQINADPDPKPWYTVLRIRMFLGLLDPDQLVREKDLDPSFIKQKKVRKTLIPTVL